MIFAINDSFFFQTYLEARYTLPNSHLIRCFQIRQIVPLLPKPLPWILNWPVSYFESYENSVYTSYLWRYSFHTHKTIKILYSISVYSVTLQFPFTGQKRLQEHMVCMVGVDDLKCPAQRSDFTHLEWPGTPTKYQAYHHQCQTALMLLWLSDHTSR